jgi:hypothetical protein
MTLKEFVLKWKSRVRFEQLIVECHPRPGTPASDLPAIMADFMKVVTDADVYDKPEDTQPGATQKAARA